MGESGYVPRSPDLSALDEPDPDPAPLSAPAYHSAYTLPPAPHSAGHLHGGYAPPTSARPLPSPYHQAAFSQQPSPLTPHGYPPQPYPMPPHQLQQGQPQPAQPCTPKPRGRPRSHSEPDDDFAPDADAKPATRPRGRKPKKPKLEAEVCDKPAPGVAEGIEVRTKFPVARIKRIMQADEDVGKVAQVTPTAVSKALELFMISIVTKAAATARAASAKKVTAAHMKRVVEGEPQFDFLEDIMAKVPEGPPPPSATRRGDEDSEGAEGGRKRRGPRRKKAEEDDDDDD